MKHDNDDDDEVKEEFQQVQRWDLALAEKSYKMTTTLY